MSTAKASTPSRAWARMKSVRSSPANWAARSCEMAARVPVDGGGERQIAGHFVGRPAKRREGFLGELHLNRDHELATNLPRLRAEDAAEPPGHSSLGFILVDYAPGIYITQAALDLPADGDVVLDVLQRCIVW